MVTRRRLFLFICVLGIAWYLTGPVIHLGYGSVEAALKGTMGDRYSIHVSEQVGHDTVILYTDETDGLHAGLLRRNLFFRYEWVMGGGTTHVAPGEPFSVARGFLRPAKRSSREPVIFLAAGQISDPNILTIVVSAQTGLKPPGRATIQDGYWYLILAGDGPAGPVTVTGLTRDGKPIFKKTV